MNIDPIGSAMFLSSKVYSSWFAQRYLFQKESSFFEPVYTDSDMSIFYFNGHFAGPIIIWKIHYPENLNIPEEYYRHSLPDSVTEIGEYEKYFV